MKRKELYQHVQEYFQKAMPEAKTELHYTTPFELLVAVILSAQCTDKRINQVTPRLFHDYPTPEAMAEATPEVLFEYIRSVSYPNNKAKHLSQMAKMLQTEYQGVVPSDLKDLTRLPGVGRKTANVIRGNVYGIDSIVVDTHVKRVSKLLGLTKSDDPEKIEMELMKLLPKEQWILYNFQAIAHGRKICVARRPDCSNCVLADVCLNQPTGV